MRILIATVKIPFIRGGAEVLAEGLRAALKAAGHQAEVVEIPFKWYPPEKILDHMLACRLLDLTESTGTKVDLLIGLKFPAYLIPHPNKVLWVLHQHRQAYDLWNHPVARDMILSPNGAEVRDAITEADSRLLPESKGVYTISKNVSSRMARFCGVESKPLYHPPPSAEKFAGRPAEDYFFFPSRLTPIKRQIIVIQALAHTRNPVRLCLAGQPDLPSYLDELKAAAAKLGVLNRIEFTGGISEEDKIDRYARCLGVVFTPVDEDYGYITLEAMLSAKPVITCTDSGGPNEFLDASTGFVVEPEPARLAAALDELWENRPSAQRMGRQALERYHSMNIGWPHVVTTLLA